MLGMTNPESNKVGLYVLATFILVFFVNVVYELYTLLPDIPTLEQFYGSFIRSLFTALMIYVANKGIQWKRKPEGSE